MQETSKKGTTMDWILFPQNSYVVFFLASERLKGTLHWVKANKKEIFEGDEGAKLCALLADIKDDYSYWARSLGGSVVKNLPANAGDTRDWFHPWVGEISWRRAWQPKPVFLLGESRGQKGLVGYGPMGLQRIKHNWAHSICLLSSNLRQLILSLPICHIIGHSGSITRISGFLEVEELVEAGQTTTLTAASNYTHTSIHCLLHFNLPFSSVQSLSLLSSFLRPHGLQHTRLPCPSPTPGVYSNPCSLCWWCHPTISSFVIPFSSCPQSFPASECFPMNQLFASGGQRTGVSASTSVLPMNTQDWSPLGWTGWISLQSKGLSRVFSNTTVQKHQFFSSQFSL